MSLSKQTRFGILGGGFGLYGWLPAISCFSEQPILLPSRYEATLQRRPELREFLDRVRFVSQEDEVIAGSSALVCAKRPQDQLHVVERGEQLGWQGHYFLEKPLAPEPVQARRLIQSIEHAGCGLSVGFTFRPTAWAANLSSWLTDPQTQHIQITWRFLAHHYRHDVVNWKRRYQQGGGALRFFAIHFLPLLSAHGPWTIQQASPITGQDDDRVSFDISNGNCVVSLECDSQSCEQPVFCIQARDRKGMLGLFHAQDPLNVTLTTNQTREGIAQEPDQSRQDARVRHLLALLEYAAEIKAKVDPVVPQHVDLWGQLERHRNQADIRTDPLPRKAG